jgi:tRNA threonylcarbamoyladenosine biosynthesis protein TsaB
MSRGLTLAVDGSTYAGSVALIRDLTVIAEGQLESTGIPGRGGRDEAFLPMVEKVMADAGVKPSDLERVVCGAGPGSFTSLRIAASIAKGIAVGVGCPLFASSSLLLMVAGREDGSYIPTLPAMRGEVHAALVEVAGSRVTQRGPAMIVPEASLDEAVKRAGAVHLSGTPHARGFAILLDTIMESGPCDVDSWQPEYGRAAEAQVKWEAAHGRPLSAAG